MTKTKIIQVRGIQVATFKIGNEDFISLTDIARNTHEEVLTQPKMIMWVFHATFEKQIIIA